MVELGNCVLWISMRSLIIAYAYSLAGGMALNYFVFSPCLTVLQVGKPPVIVILNSLDKNTSTRASAATSTGGPDLAHRVQHI